MKNMGYRYATIGKETLIVQSFYRLKNIQQCGATGTFRHIHWKILAMSFGGKNMKKGENVKEKGRKGKEKRKWEVKG